jgi:hypothetical protein
MRKLTALLAVVLLVGCKNPTVSVELKGQPAVTAPPRYQIIINTQEWTGANAEAFLLDTQRGRVWAYNRFYEANGVGEGQHFFPIEIIDDEGAMGMTSKEWFSFQDFKKAQLAEKVAKGVATSKANPKEKSAIEELEEALGTPPPVPK